MTRREESIIKTTALSLWYYDTYKENDGEAVKDAFGEYFTLMKDSPIVDKAVLANAITVIDTFEREKDFINSDVIVSATEMRCALSDMLAENCIVHDFREYSKNVDEYDANLDEWLETPQIYINALLKQLNIDEEIKY